LYLQARESAGRTDSQPLTQLLLLPPEGVSPFALFVLALLPERSQVYTKRSPLNYKRFSSEARDAPTASR